MPDLKQRFEKSVSKGDGCWLWTASTRNGYGRLRVGERKATASRVSYELYIGPIPEQMVVCHRCDNPTCVNPAHLFLGSRADNMDDMIAKGRHIAGKARGEENGRAKLSLEQVAAIRQDTRSQSAIAAEYQVGQALISKIKLRKLWRHA